METLKVIVAGGRDFIDVEAATDFLNRVYQKRYVRIEVVCGEAIGADLVGRRIAEANNCTIHSFPAQWDTFGRSAGYRRNAEMGNFADELVAFWDGKSKGTRHMITYMQKLGKPVHIYVYGD